MSHRLSCDYIVCFRFLYVCVGVCHSYFYIVVVVVVVLSFDVLLSLLLLVEKEDGVVYHMGIYIIVHCFEKSFLKPFQFEHD